MRNFKSDLTYNEVVDHLQQKKKTLITTSAEYTNHVIARLGDFLGNKVFVLFQIFVSTEDLSDVTTAIDVVTVGDLSNLWGDVSCTTTCTYSQKICCL